MEETVLEQISELCDGVGDDEIRKILGYLSSKLGEGKQNTPFAELEEWAAKTPDRSVEYEDRPHDSPCIVVCAVILKDGEQHEEFCARGNTNDAAKYAAAIEAVQRSHMFYRVEWQTDLHTKTDEELNGILGYTNRILSSRRDKGAISIIYEWARRKPNREVNWVVCQRCHNKLTLCVFENKETMFSTVKINGTLKVAKRIAAEKLIHSESRTFDFND